MKMKYNVYNSNTTYYESDAICIRKTIDLTNVTKIKLLVSTGGTNYSFRLWALNPETKKGVTLSVTAAGVTSDGSSDYTEKILDVSSLTGHCLIGLYRHTGATKSGIIRVKEFSLVA